MGCDGGTIPTRGELVRTKKKPEQVSKENELMTKWKHCAISQTPLKQPIVACQLGRLYNKEAVLEFLLDKSSKCDKSVEHIRTLKDVKELRLSNNPAFDADRDAKAGAGQDPCGIAPFVCPVTGLEMNGRFRFCFILACGCVFAERAVQELKGSNLCFTCGASFATDDVIVINGSEEEVASLRQSLEERRAKAKNGKKSKKAAVSAAEGCPSAAAAAEVEVTAAAEEEVTAAVEVRSTAAKRCAQETEDGTDTNADVLCKKQKLVNGHSASTSTASDEVNTTESHFTSATVANGSSDGKSTANGSAEEKSTANGSAAEKSTANGSSAGKSTANGSAAGKSTTNGSAAGKSTANGSAVGKFTANGSSAEKSVVQSSSSKSSSLTSKGGSSSSNGTMTADPNKAARKASSIQSDPKASEAFKSLFNTHETALRQPRAHWVTYNPQYN